MSSIFTALGQQYQNATDSVVNGAISSIIGHLTGPVTLGVTVYFLITGYMIIAGRIQEPIGDLAIKAFKISVVSALALDAGGVATYVISSVHGIESMFISAFSGQSDVSAFQMLDNSLVKGLESSASAMAKAQKLNFLASAGEMISLWILALIIVLATVIMVVVGGAILLLSKVALSVILGLTPFFLVSLMFPITARFADSWINQALNYILVSTIVIFVLGFGVSLFEIGITGVEADVAAGNSFPIVGVGGLVILAVSTHVILLQAPTIAAGLAGGMASAGASLVGMAVGVKRAGDYAMSPMKMANGTSSRLDPSSGMHVQSSRAGHFAAGRSLASSGYRQAVMSRVKKNWTGNSKGGSVGRG